MRIDGDIIDNCHKLTLVNINSGRKFKQISSLLTANLQSDIIMHSLHKDKINLWTNMHWSNKDICLTRSIFSPGCRHVCVFKVECMCRLLPLQPASSGHLKNCSFLHFNTSFIFKKPLSMDTSHGQAPTIDWSENVSPGYLKFYGIQVLHYDRISTRTCWQKCLMHDWITPFMAHITFSLFSCDLLTHLLSSL